MDFKQSETKKTLCVPLQGKVRRETVIFAAAQAKK